MSMKVFKVAGDDHLVDDINKMIDELEETKGMSRLGAVRLGLKALLAGHSIISSPTPIKEKELQIPKRVQDDLDDYLSRPGDLFCPNHASKMLDQCPCLTDGGLLKGLMRFHGYSTE